MSPPPGTGGSDGGTADTTGRGGGPVDEPGTDVPDSTEVTDTTPPAGSPAFADSPAVADSTEVAGSTETVRWRMTVAYDGSGFHGFAAQRDQRTVAGALGEALAKVVRVPVALTCAGRTDSGVHALHQVVHFDVPADRAAALDPDDVVSSCNSQLGPAIVVRDAGAAPPASTPVIRPRPAATATWW